MLRFLVILAAFAAAVPVQNGNNLVPEQVRIAYAGCTGMTVSWNTYAHVQEPSVAWGLSPNDLSHVATSNISVTYETSTTHNNHVKIEGLKPDTVYYYLPIHSSNGTEPYSFRTSRVAGSDTPFTVAVVVDLGTMGGYGLTTHVGDGAANPLKKGERNTIESLTASMSDWDFLWHGKHFTSNRRMGIICLQS